MIGEIFPNIKTSDQRRFVQVCKRFGQLKPQKLIAPYVFNHKQELCHDQYWHLIDKKDGVKWLKTHHYPWDQDILSRTQTTMDVVEWIKMTYDSLMNELMKLKLVNEKVIY